MIVVTPPLLISLISRPHKINLESNHNLQFSNLHTSINMSDNDSDSTNSFEDEDKLKSTHQPEAKPPTQDEGTSSNNQANEKVPDTVSLRPPSIALPPSSPMDGTRENPFKSMASDAIRTAKPVWRYPALPDAGLELVSCCIQHGSTDNDQLLCITKLNADGKPYRLYSPTDFMPDVASVVQTIVDEKFKQFGEIGASDAQVATQCENALRQLMIPSPDSKLSQEVQAHFKQWITSLVLDVMANAQSLLDSKPAARPTATRTHSKGNVTNKKNPKKRSQQAEDSDSDDSVFETETSTTRHTDLKQRNKKIVADELLFAHKPDLSEAAMEEAFSTRHCVWKKVKPDVDAEIKSRDIRDKEAIIAYYVNEVYKPISKRCQNTRNVRIRFHIIWLLTWHVGRSRFKFDEPGLQALWSKTSAAILAQAGENSNHIPLTGHGTSKEVVAEAKAAGIIH